MKRLAGWRRWLVIIGLVLIIALGGLRQFLVWGGATNSVASALAQQLGGHVTIATSRVPFLGNSSLTDLALYEPDRDEPVLQARHVVADISALGYLFGTRQPHRVEIDDAHLRLRFDADGTLLTHLDAKQSGAALPALRLRDSQLTIEQQGRPTFTLKGVTLDLEPGAGQNLTGRIDDPTWGPLKVTGTVDPQTLAFSFTLAHERLALDTPMLRSLPFVPPALWQQIELEGSAVPLRFTLAIAPTAPRVRYRVEFSGARVRIPQPDRPAFTAAPAHGVLDGNENGFHLDGTIADPLWGHWTVAARMVAKTGAIGLTLVTPGVEVNQARLEALPYVPKLVWNQIRNVLGRAAARVEVGLWTTRPDVHYRVELSVPRTRIEVAAISLQAEHASGGVVIEDSVVTLKGVHGLAADGRLSVDGKLDFRKEPSRLHFQIKAAGLALRKLPAKWGLPSMLEGKLGGHADLTVLVRTDKVETWGSGMGQITDAKVLGFRNTGPLTLTLKAEGDSLRFLTPSAMLNSLLVMSRPGAIAAPRVARPAAPRRSGSVEPDKVVSQVKEGVGWATGKVASGASAALSGLGRFGRSLKPGEPTTYLNAKVTLDDVNLPELIRRTGVELPKELALAGKLSLHVQVGIPINKAADYKAYRLDGEATSAQLSISGVDFRKLAAHVNYRNGVLRLDKLAGEVGGGSFAGKAQAEVFPRGNLSLNLDMKRLPVASLERLVPGGGRFLSGALTGRVTASTAINDLANPQKWRGKAALRGTVVDIQGLTLRNLSANVVLAGGKLDVPDLRGEVGTAPLRGSATLSLLDKQPVKANLSVRGLDLSLVRAMLPKSWQYLKPAGRADLTARLSGTLTPLALRPTGTLEARNLRINDIRARSLNLNWRLRGQTLDLESVDAKLYRGTLAGSASLPLDGDEKKPIQLNLIVNNIDAGALAKALGGLPVELSGRLSGQAKLTMRRAGRGWRGSAVITSRQLVIRGIAATQVRGTVKWNGSRADYRINGGVLGGTFSVEGTYPSPPMRSVGRYDGRLELRQISLSRLAQALGLGERFRRLEGVASLRLPFRFDRTGGRPVGQGRFELRDVRLNDTELTDSLIGSIRVGNDGIFIRDINSTLAGGQLRLSVEYRFNDPNRSRFSLNLAQGELSRLLAFDPDLKERFSGPVEVMLRGTLGEEARGGGSVVLTHGKAFGIEISEWRIPIDFTFAVREGRLEVVVRESGAQLGAGRALVHASLLWTGTMRVEGSVRFIDASLRSLSGITGDISSYATGRISGRIDFSGSEMRSVNDLTATVLARLRDAQALQLPVLSVLTPFLLPGQGATTFNNGDLKGRLAGGVFRISRLSLESPAAALMIQGNVSLAGRLDLDVVARTGQVAGVNPVVVRLILSRLPVAGPTPVGLLLQATNLFANRVVHLLVTGTLRHPVVQVKPLQLLSDEAVRFFLGLAIGGNATLP